MTTTLTPPPVQPPTPPKPRAKLGDRLLFGYTWLVILWLCLPIGVMILFGFNQVQGRYNNRWHGFTLEWYAHVFDLSGLTNALEASLIIAVDANRRAVKLATQLYTEGQTNFLDVLLAQRSLLVSEDALVQSERTMATNLIALYKALGGGWEISP